ncbi:MAG TPA: hypothetical protein VK363_01710 [Pyrinomonadaceae bacterium]|nr:hypothetical protein [Pyrinomonadaceae bacterium]
MNSAGEGKSKRTKLIYGLLLVSALLALGLGYYLEHRAPFWSHIARDIGISGLVGYYLAYTFERLSADEYKRLAEEERATSAREFRRLTEEEREAIKKDVFFYVLGHDLPQEIRDEISTQILKSLLIRRHLTLIFELDEIKAPDTGDSYMLTKCIMSYSIENLTKVNQPFLPRPSVDKSPVASLAHETKFTSLSVKGCEQPLELKERELHELLDEHDTEMVLKLKNPIIVLPGTMTTVQIEYQTARFMRRGHLDFVFTTHTCELDLSVRVRNPEVRVFATANANSELKADPLKHRPSYGVYNWKIDRPLIAYQGISITWARDATVGSGNAPPLLEGQTAASGSAQLALAGAEHLSDAALDSLKLKAGSPTPDGDGVGAEQ